MRTGAFYRGARGLAPLTCQIVRSQYYDTMPLCYAGAIPLQFKLSIICYLISFIQASEFGLE